MKNLIFWCLQFHHVTSFAIGFNSLEPSFAPSCSCEDSLSFGGTDYYSTEIGFCYNFSFEYSNLIIPTCGYDMTTNNPVQLRYKNQVKVNEFESGVGLSNGRQGTWEIGMNGYVQVNVSSIHGAIKAQYMIGSTDGGNEFGCIYGSNIKGNRGDNLLANGLGAEGVYSDFPENFTSYTYLSFTACPDNTILTADILVSYFKINNGVSCTAYPTEMPSFLPSYTPSASPSSIPSYLPSHVPSVSPSYVPSSVPSSIPTVRPTDNPSIIPTAPSWSPTVKPTNLPSSSPSVIPSSSPSAKPSRIPTCIPSANPSAVPSEKPSFTPTSTPTIKPSAPTIEPTVKPSASPSERPTSVPSNFPSVLPTTPTVSPSVMPSSTPTCYPTIKPSTPTGSPSSKPSSNPSTIPSVSPTALPSIQPTTPTQIPSHSPSSSPSTSPSATPSNLPTTNPSTSPTFIPSYKPSFTPSSLPTASPSCTPSSTPSIIPSYVPSLSPTFIPTITPSFEPTFKPTFNPSNSPSVTPTRSKNYRPTAIPTCKPSAKPTSTPSYHPSFVPTTTPSGQPSAEPSHTPSSIPSTEPSFTPSMNPTYAPSFDPSAIPSVVPSSRPSKTPLTCPYPASPIITTIRTVLPAYFLVYQNITLRLPLEFSSIVFLDAVSCAFLKTAYAIGLIVTIDEVTDRGAFGNTDFNAIQILYRVYFEYPTAAIVTTQSISKLAPQPQHLQRSGRRLKDSISIATTMNVILTASVSNDDSLMYEYFNGLTSQFDDSILSGNFSYLLNYYSTSLSTFNNLYPVCYLTPQYFGPYKLSSISPTLTPIIGGDENTNNNTSKKQSTFPLLITVIGAVTGIFLLLFLCCVYFVGGILLKKWRKRKEDSEKALNDWFNTADAGDIIIYKKRKQFKHSQHNKQLQYLGTDDNNNNNNNTMKYGESNYLDYDSPDYMYQANLDDLYDRPTYGASLLERPSIIPFGLTDNPNIHQNHKTRIMKSADTTDTTVFQNNINSDPDNQMNASLDTSGGNMSVKLLKPLEGLLNKMRSNFSSSSSPSSSNHSQHHSSGNNNSESRSGERGVMNNTHSTNHSQRQTVDIIAKPRHLAHTPLCYDRYPINSYRKDNKNPSLYRDSDQTESTQQGDERYTEEMTSAVEHSSSSSSMTIETTDERYIN